MLQCKGIGDIISVIGHLRPLNLKVLVVSGQVLGFDMLLGFDAIKKFGGVRISKVGEVCFPQMRNQCAAAWNWAGGQIPAQLKNCIPEYRVANYAHKEYDEELKEWINNSWLVPYSWERTPSTKRSYSPYGSSTSQANKVCLVLDYRELNEHEDGTRSWGCDSWSEKGLPASSSPQIPVVVSDYNLEGTLILNLAHMIVRSIMIATLFQDLTIKQATSAYIDDVYNNETIVSPDKVKKHEGKLQANLQGPWMAQRWSASSRPSCSEIWQYARREARR